MTWQLTSQAGHNEHDWSITAEFFLTLICPVQRDLPTIRKGQNVPEGGREGREEWMDLCHCMKCRLHGAQHQVLREDNNSVQSGM